MEIKPQYDNSFSNYYDLFYSEKNYNEEVDFIIQKLRLLDLTIPILEMACGTGNHAFEFEKHGFKNYLAFDFSKHQISNALLKKEKNNSAIQFEIADMCHFDKGNEQFELVLCLFDSIGFVLSNNNIQLVFQNVYKSLKSNGIFVFEFWHTAAMVKNYDPQRTKIFERENEKIVRTSNTSLNIEKQTADVSYTICSEKNGITQTFTETQTNRFFSIQEMLYFIENNGFKALSFHDGFTNNQTISKDTWHVVCFAQKVI